MFESVSLRREGRVDLSELTSIRLGISALKFHQYVNSTELIMRSGDSEMK